MKKQVEDWVLLAELGLLPDGIPADEQARAFIEYAKEIKTIILESGEFSKFSEIYSNLTLYMWYI